MATVIMDGLNVIRIGYTHKSKGRTKMLDLSEHVRA